MRGGLKEVEVEEEERRRKNRRLLGRSRIRRWLVGWVSIHQTHRQSEGEGERKRERTQI